MKNAVWNCLLALSSVAVALALAEGVLRVIHPAYEHLADPPARDAQSAYLFRHPDTGQPHAVIHNNLGGRQHRNFTERDLAEGVNVAVFGDSFTENLRMPAPYSFTEVLDFLLNDRTAVAGAQPIRFNVLNLGVAGTGPGRQYIRYRALASRHDLRHVVYVHCFNDVGDVRNAAQWATRRSGQQGPDQAGRLVARLRRETSLWPRVVAGLQLAYLGMDAWHRLAGVDPATEAPLGPPALWGEDGDAPFDSDALAVFAAVLEHWRAEVRANGGVFHVVLLPRESDGAWFERSESLARWDVVDLRRCFADAVPGYRYEDFRFARDGHWNEAGNMLAARCLYRHLEKALRLLPKSDDELARGLHVYYAAFRDSAAWRGARFMPGRPWAVPSVRPHDEARRVVARYLALGADAAARVGAARAAEYQTIARTAPAVRSVWNVHARRARRELVYLKAPCGTEDNVRDIFLRVRPADAPLEVGSAAEGGFVDVPLQFADTGLALFDGKCMMTVPLPEWRIGTVWTGGRGRNAPRWGAKFQWDLAGLRRARRDVGGRRPEAAGAFDVHHVGGALTYVRAPCTRADVRHRFFLHMFGPAGRFANGDFDFAERGAVIDDACVAVVRLPDREVVRVRTGQFDRDADARLWEVEFATRRAD